MAGAGTDAPPPVLYLLHGLSDDDTIWLRRTSIERHVAELGLAVVMPQVHRSFYLDGEYTGAYWTFVAEELPALVAGSFRLSQAEGGHVVAQDLWMGGYGAMLHALRQPGGTRARQACQARSTSARGRRAATLTACCAPSR